MGMVIQRSACAHHMGMRMPCWTAGCGCWMLGHKLASRSEGYPVDLGRDTQTSTQFRRLLRSSEKRRHQIGLP